MSSHSKDNPDFDVLLVEDEHLIALSILNESFKVFGRNSIVMAIRSKKSFIQLSAEKLTNVRCVILDPGVYGVANTDEAREAFIRMVVSSVPCDCRIHVITGKPTKLEKKLCLSLGATYTPKSSISIKFLSHLVRENKPNANSDESPDKNRIAYSELSPALNRALEAYRLSDGCIESAALGLGQSTDTFRRTLMRANAVLRELTHDKGTSNG